MVGLAQVIEYWVVMTPVDADAFSEAFYARGLDRFGTLSSTSVRVWGEERTKIIITTSADNRDEFLAALDTNQTLAWWKTTLTESPFE